MPSLPHVPTSCKIVTVSIIMFLLAWFVRLTCSMSGVPDIGYTTVAHYTLLGELYTFTNCKNSMVPGESPLHRSHGGSALTTQTCMSHSRPRLACHIACPVHVTFVKLSTPGQFGVVCPPLLPFTALGTPTLISSKLYRLSPWSHLYCSAPYVKMVADLGPSKIILSGACTL